MSIFNEAPCTLFKTNASYTLHVFQSRPISSTVLGIMKLLWVAFTQLHTLHNIALVRIPDNMTTSLPQEFPIYIFIM